MISRIRLRRPVRRGTVARQVLAKRLLVKAGRLLILAEEALSDADGVIRGLVNDREKTAPAAKGR